MGVVLPGRLAVDQPDAHFGGFIRRKPLPEVAGIAGMAVMATRAIQHGNLASSICFLEERRGS